MVWYGNAWHGMVWYGMVWYGMVGIVWCGAVRRSMALYGTDSENKETDHNRMLYRTIPLRHQDYQMSCTTNIYLK